MKCRTYPFSCSTLPKPWYNQPVQLELDSADLLIQEKHKKIMIKIFRKQFWPSWGYFCVCVRGVGSSLSRGLRGGKCCVVVASLLVPKTHPGFWGNRDSGQRDGLFVQKSRYTEHRSKFIGQIRKHTEDNRSFIVYKHGKQKSQEKTFKSQHRIAGYMNAQFNKYIHIWIFMYFYMYVGVHACKFISQFCTLNGASSGNTSVTTNTTIQLLNIIIY